MYFGGRTFWKAPINLGDRVLSMNSLIYLFTLETNPAIDLGTHWALSDIMQATCRWVPKVLDGSIIHIILKRGDHRILTHSIPATGRWVTD